MAHAAEATHYYTRTGEPAYTVKAKAGHERPTHVGDARKLGLVPSVTTIIKCADRPGLTNWMIDQAILAALTMPVVAGELEDAYLARIKRDSKEQARKAAERGTSIHAAIQGFFQHEDSIGYEPYIQAACSAITNWAGDGYDPECCVVEKPFACQMGFGGKVDIFGTSPLFVADFKTKEFNEGSDLKTWDEHAMQLAAYRHGLEMPNARCAIVYVSTTQPGLAKLIEIPEPDLVKGWRCFYSLLQFWKAKNGYDSAFERALAA